MSDHEIKFSRKRMPKTKSGSQLIAVKRLPDGSKRALLGSRTREHPDYKPRPMLEEKPESIEERGAVTFAILKAYRPGMTVYEVAKRAGMLSSMGDVRRTLAYHKKKCVSMRKRIDDLTSQLANRKPTEVIIEKE